MDVDGLNLTLTADERRVLAGELADDLAARGLSLGDVERLAPLVVDRFRLTVPRGAAQAGEGGGGRDGYDSRGA